MQESMITFKQFKDILRRGADGERVFVYANADGTPNYGMILNALAMLEKKEAQEWTQRGSTACANSAQANRDFIYSELLSAGFYNDIL